MSLSNKELLQKIKDEVAKEWFAKGWSVIDQDHPEAKWSNLSNPCELTLGGDSDLMTIVCERYASEKAKELLPKEKKEPEPRNLNSPYNCPIDNKPCYMSNCIHSDTQPALCGNKEEKMQSVESSGPQEKEPDSFYGYLEEGVYGEFRHVPEPSPNKNKIGFIFGSKRYEFTRCPAPVESQEEMWLDVAGVFIAAGYGDAAHNHLLRTFSITRLTP